MYLLRRIGRGQGLIGCIELLTKLINSGSQRDEFLFCAFIFPQRGDGLNNFVFIDLCREIDMDDDRAVFEARAGLLIEHHDDAGGVCPDLITRDVQVPDFSHTFQIGRDLLERLPFGVLNGHPSGIYPSVMITHTIFTGGCDDEKDGLLYGLQGLNGR